MSDALEIFLQHKIIAVVTGPRAGTLVHTGMAVAEGGIRMLAVPASAPELTEAVSELADQHELRVGLTGVVAQEQVALALAVGAQFVITPTCEPEVVRMCRDRGLIVIAGAATPTEVQLAAQLAPHFVGVYPASLLGGPTYLNMLARDFLDVPLVAAGGVDVDSGPAYLEAGARAIVVDRGLFPEQFNRDTLHILSARASALVEVCASIHAL